MSPNGLRSGLDYIALGKSMNNLWSYCGLVDPRISASDKDLPVRQTLPKFSDSTLSLSQSGRGADCASY